MKKGKFLGIIILVGIALVASGVNGKETKSSPSSTKSSVTADSSVKEAQTEKEIEEPTNTLTIEPTETPTSTPTEAPTKVPLLQSGSKGEDVINLQELLIEYNYLSGDPSGKYDSATVKAMKDFQINNGLKETGKCNEEVWEVITAWPVRQYTVYQSKKGKVYHSRSNCSGMKNPKEMKLSDALRKKLRPCSHCN